MISTDLDGSGRSRRYWLRGAAGVTLTLAVVTAACATALPPKDTVLSQHPAAKAVPVSVAKAAPVAPPAPTPVFDCGQPVVGATVDSPFGLRRLPWERHGRLHEGVDIPGPLGEPVLAVADGIIAKAGESPSYGRYVEVEHGAGLTTFYAHLGRIARDARPGEFVVRGHPLGKMGLSGDSTGPHLHFEIRRQGKPLNPASFLGREFQTQADLPLKAASYVSPHVRVAQVSSIPERKQALMAQVSGKPARPATDAGADSGARVHQPLQFPSLHAPTEGSAQPTVEAAS